MKAITSSRTSRLLKNKNALIAAVVAAAVFVIGYILFSTYAAGPFAALEGEDATLSPNASLVDDPLASGGQAIQFAGGSTEPPSTEAPTLQTTEVATGLGKLWDIAFTPDGSMLVAHYDGRMSFAEPGGSPQEFFTVSDVRAQGEGGLLGMTVDSQFATNRHVYACYASQSNDVRVVRWVLAADNSTLESATPIITGIDYNQSGRHSGCRVRMDKSNVLWVGTGDAAIESTPQDPQSLAGKILRVNRDGTAASGNLSAPFDDRIYSYGHRNTQGIALYDTPLNGSAGFSVEHGSDEDDEVNRLVPGNFGWNPGPGYDENVPMTDTGEYPDAVEAAWSSGAPTIAPSGATLLTGTQWKGWNGRLAVAVLKEQHLMIQQYNQDGQLQGSERFLQDDYGRIRSAVQGTDGNLYLATDSGAIVRVTPQ